MLSIGLLYKNIGVAHTHKKMSKHGVELKSYNSLQYLV